MLEKDSWSNASTGVFSSSPKSNSIIEASSIAFENTKSSRYVFESVKMDSNNNKICRNDTTPCEKTTAVEDNTFSDALGNITHTGNNLDFLDNTEDKDSSEFLYHGWPEIENFEDVDRMLRSCHSTFGLGISKEDDLDWFTSADNLGGSGDVVTSESEFPCPDLNPVDYISQNHDSSKGNFVNDFAMPKDSSWTSDEPDSYVSFMNGPAVANSEDRFIPKEQINGNKNQVKLQNQFIRKRKEHCSGNGSFIYTSNLPNEAMQLSPSYMHSNDSPSDITSVNLASSAAKSENHELQDDPQFPAAGSGEREKLRNRQGSLKNPTATVQASIVDPGLIGKQVQYSGEKSENHSDAEQASHVMQAELSSSHIQERSTMSLGMDDISQEEASFRQLQLVVEQVGFENKDMHKGQFIPSGSEC
ncbi:hypothetical protein OROMI_033347 [Orobanche minor]